MHLRLAKFTYPYTKYMKLNLKEPFLDKIPVSNKNFLLMPIFSGGAAVYLLNKIIFSDIDNRKFELSLLAVSIMFFVSVILYFLLRKLEKEKDQYFISSVGKIVEDVFRRYGQQGVKFNADNFKAEDMNKIMQTIVILVGKMSILADKKYVSDK